MESNRLEAFSDGVLAIIITIMVLELRPPHGEAWTDLAAIWPTFVSYVLSFIYVGIYWNNHHHLLKACERVSGGMLWANLHLLFWLSLFPFAASYQAEHHFGEVAAALYGIVLLMAAVSYTILVRVMLRNHAADSPLARAIGSDRKGYLSLLLYIVAIIAAFFAPIVSQLAYVTVAIIWLVPDRRIERELLPGAHSH